MKFSKWSARSVLVAALIVNCQDDSFAGDRWRLFGHRASKPDPSCEAPACTATATATAPAPVTTEAASAPPEQSVATAQVAPSPVMFAAPPAGGTITGEQNSVQIRGAGFTMPQVHLEMPTFHLPSIVRSRRNPEMLLDGGRAPMVSGAPAAYGQLANAGLATGQQFGQASIPPSTSPASVTPRTKPATTTAPASTTPTVAPADTCIPPVPACDPSAAYQSTDEINEMRQTLVTYRQELERVKRALDMATASRPGIDTEAELPPAPDDSPIRRLSYTSSAKNSSPVRRRQPPKAVEADQDEVYEQDELPLSPRRSIRVSPAAKSSSAPKGSSRVPKN